MARRHGRTDVTGPLSVVLDAPDVLWAGRIATNPVHRISPPSDWQVHPKPGHENVSATSPSTGARLEVVGDRVVLSVPLSDIWIEIRFTLPEATVDGGAPMVSTEDAAAAMRSVLAIAAGTDVPEALPTVLDVDGDKTATVTVEWDPERVADHTGVTATFGDTLWPTLTVIPDAVVGLCWPAVFATIGSAVTETGFPVVEGLLSLVHLDHAAHLLSQLPKEAVELTVTATASAAYDTEVGRVVPVSVKIATSEGELLATLEERFAIRGRNGEAELDDPVRAGGAVSDNATDTPRRRRRDVTVTAPGDMHPFAVVSGDHNPIHTDRAAALLAGLESPIVHGMWLSAAAQHVATATDGKPAAPAKLVGWTARFLGMVLPGDEVDFRVDRVGIDQGAEVLEISARVGSDLKMSATARLASPKTVYAFPGQGIQYKGMGMDVRARSKAARKVWDSADKFTRETLGFSVLHVVRDNPTSLIASGVRYHHPEGVLYLTQFTQVAMATVAAAQVAEMREQGAFVEDAIACGHSVGEYTALACVSGVYELEALLEVVFHRGSKMHDIVPRDEHGRSNYRLAAIRPSQIDLDDADVTDFVAEISERTGEFLQIVNFNLRGSQYAIAGTVRGPGGTRGGGRAASRDLRRQAVVHPGARHRRAVPLQRAAGRRGRLPAFAWSGSCRAIRIRRSSSGATSRTWCPGRSPWTATSSRRSAIWCRPSRSTRSSPTTTPGVTSGPPSCAARSSSSCWPGSSPARCAGSRPRICCSSKRPPAVSGVERFVEIGVKSAPTVAGLATNTLKLPEYSHSTVEVLNSERDAAVLFATDTDPEPEHGGRRSPCGASRSRGPRSRRGRAGRRPRGAVGRPAAR